MTGMGAAAGREIEILSREQQMKSREKSEKSNYFFEIFVSDTHNLVLIFPFFTLFNSLHDDGP